MGFPSTINYSKLLQIEGRKIFQTFWWGFTTQMVIPLWSDYFEFRKVNYSTNFDGDSWSIQFPTILDGVGWGDLATNFNHTIEEYEHSPIHFVSVGF